MVVPSVRIHRILLTIVGAIAVATIVGLIALWPRAADIAVTEPEPLDDLVNGELAEVEIVQSEPDELVGLSGEVAHLEVVLHDGPDAGDVLNLEIPTDGYPEMRVGDRVLLDKGMSPDGTEQYYITDFARLGSLAWLVGLFVLAVLVVSRWHGLRALLGLGLSLLVVVLFVVPAILAGSSPPVVALVGALTIMIVTLYLTHGVNAMTTSAVVGTGVALTLTVGLGLLFIDRVRITGFASSDATFARFAVEGLDLQGLVLAGLIIATLGVLDDVTIAQSSTVFAIHDTDRTLGWASLFQRAMKVGRDHIASVVNTLFLAYTGASIALFLLFSTGGVGPMEIINTEVLAEEIVKTVVGSLGLIAAVPLTTALAALVAIQRNPGNPAIAGGHHHPAPSSAARGPGPGAFRPSAGTVSASQRDVGGGDGQMAHPQVAPDALDGAPDTLDEEERATRAWAAYLAREGITDEPAIPDDATDDPPEGAR